MRYFETWEQIGTRVAQAREARGLTQAQLSSSVGLDRTAIAKIERGRRSISSLELGQISNVLSLPLEWFITEPPQSVVSRRSDQLDTSPSTSLDLELERVSRDVELLLEIGGLPKEDSRDPSSIRSHSQAEDLATSVRTELGESAAIPNLQLTAERLGLYAFSFEMPAGTSDGAYVLLEGAGVAIINGSMPAGRRRFTLAHEIGHHVLSDAYSVDHSLFDDISGAHERLLNAFAIFLLMPRNVTVKLWGDAEGHVDPRGATISLAAYFGVSWTAACAHLLNLGLIDEDRRTILLSQPPTRADYIERALVFQEELIPPSLPPRYSAAVIGSYRRNKITSTRALELLHHTLTEDELPETYELPLEALTPEFNES